MTAGSGIIHQEMPEGDAAGPHVAAFSCGPTCPPRHKMMEPRYREVKRAEIPLVTLAERRAVRVVCGAGERRARPGAGHRHRAANIWM